MPEENISCMPKTQLMQPEEIEAIAHTFITLGVKKIRLTGGEPLVRKEFKDILLRLNKFPVALTLTTNGLFADQYIREFHEAGVNSLNVSIDTLKPDKFKAITRRDSLQKVWQNILLLVDEGFHVKLNIVAMKGVNDDEVLDFVAVTKDLPLHVRFIEFMPFSGNQWEKDRVVSAKTMLDTVAKKYSFIKLDDKKHATAKKYQVPGYAGTFAFITTMSEPFCGDCNRMRLTADGKMKNCLFSKQEISILDALRKGDDIVPVIKKCLGMKQAVMGGQFDKTFETVDSAKLQNRSMIHIGG